MKLRCMVLDQIEGRCSHSFLRPCLTALSYAFRAAVFLRNFAYDKRLITRVRAPVRVMSVGNIACGGTGKTPLVRLLAEELSKNQSVAILSRGYRSEIERSNRVVNISKISDPSPALCGDEPLFLAKNLPRVPVWVGKKRISSAALAAKEGAQLLILDDGLQHRQLERDVEIIVVDGEDPLGKGYFLPRGYLRDSPKRLREADLIVVNHVRDRHHFHTVQKELARFSAAPIAGASFVLQQYPELQGKRVGLFCGIGRPERFIAGMKQQADVIATLLLEDHVVAGQQRLEKFAQESQRLGASFLVCTEKDAIKLQNVPLPLPILSVRGRLEIIEGRKEWDAFLQKVQNI